MGTRNAEERRKAAGKHRKESFSVKLEVVAKYEPQANKSFLREQGKTSDVRCCRQDDWKDKTQDGSSSAQK